MTDPWMSEDARERLGCAAAQAIYHAMGWRFQFGITNPLPPGLKPDLTSAVFCESPSPTTMDPLNEEEEPRYWFGVKFWAYRVPRA